MPLRTPPLALAVATLALTGLVAATGATPTAATPRDAPSAESPTAEAPAAPRVTTTHDRALEPVRGTPSAVGPYQARPAPFALTVDGFDVGHGVLAFNALPGEPVALAIGEAASGRFTLRYDAGEAVDVTGEGRLWRWTPPAEPGIHALEVTRGEGAEGGAPSSIRLNVLVLHPAEHVEGDALHGFRIGRYAETPLGGRAEYLPPTGFVHVPDGDEDVLVSPHFALGQFLSKQQGEPRFLAFSPPLALKLEAVLEAANEAGIAAGTFFVMSGFRTPWYNRAIGNTTIYSRHLWGDAADIFVDRDGDGDMDDLNGDGRRDLDDARVLARLVEQVEARAARGVRAGGIGLYRRNAAHGPFVHVDARGHAARW